MARECNELSPTQQDTALFNELVQKIKKIGVSNLIKFGNLSGVTIWKYCRREAINPRHEAELKQMVGRAISAKSERAKAEIEETRKLLSSC